MILLGRRVVLPPALKLRAFAGAILLVVVLGSSASPVGAQSIEDDSSSQQGAADVRIAARRLADGRLESALQQRTGQSWGERRLPDERYVPADATTGEWRNSTALTIDPVGQVRISARVHDDGRVEFALQQQVQDSWSDHLLPRQRIFPVDAEIGIWLVTTPLSVTAAAPAQTPEALPESIPDAGPGGSTERVMGCLGAAEGGEPAFARFDESPFTQRTSNGRRNNLNQRTWGMAGTALLKLAPNSYADGTSTPTTSRPNPRTISNLVLAQDGSVFNSSGASDITWQWGQFIDHDITLSPDDLDEPFAIPVPQGDPFFDPDGTGEASINLHRSAFDPETGRNERNPRRQINVSTAFIDASMVYGSDIARAQALRLRNGTGKLRTSHDGRFLPYNTQGIENEGGNDLTTLFLAGDVRANEQIGLIAMHTLLVREHNRLADLISSQNPALNGEEIYQLARKIVGAQVQAVTFNEFLPLLLGPEALGPYAGYDPSVNPTIASEFSAAAYRVGHTLLSPSLLLLNADGERDQVRLSEVFFNPSFVVDRGISPILRGLATQPAQEVDALVIDEVRNFLLRGPGGPSFDLTALNIQRSRDHGVGDFNTVRRAYGLPPVESFADISSNVEVQRALMLAYGNVDDLDLWPAALAEDHVPGASVGATLQAVIADQFRRLRDGDRFWFENDRYLLDNPGLLDEIRHTTLARIIRCNTPIDGEIQDNAFIVRDN